MKTLLPGAGQGVMIRRARLPMKINEILHIIRFDKRLKNMSKNHLFYSG
jgi:hypothetical protein